MNLEANVAAANAHSWWLWINYKVSLYKQTTHQNEKHMHICNQMASVEIFQ